MASANIHWMPAPGRYAVDVGSSLGRSLKARKGVTAPKRTKVLPDRSLYSFRYNFKPESIEVSKPGTIEVQRGKESTHIRVERPSAQAGESHVFKAMEQPVKEVDCVLIYDEELGTFTLEKLDSFLSLTYDKKIAGTDAGLPPQSASPLPIPSPASRSKEDSDLENELERDLGLADIDADGEPDDEYEEIITKPVPRKEEEEEEEISPAPPVAPVAPPPKSPHPTKASKRIEALPSKPKPKPKLKAKEGGKSKREHDSRSTIDSELEEVLDFGVPARPAKRPKPSSSNGLALPGASSSFISLPPAREAPITLVESDSDSDWDVVAGEDPVDAPLDGADDGADVEQEIDLDVFAGEMELELGGSEDDAAQPEPEAIPGASGRPISLKEFAGGHFSPDEDDTSSSEDSDDD
ncbi:RNA polymerase II transcription elongation factor-domain-containing protein [Hygrophoropsis aurantiaca]|uniref:RNA polymerase II transcription elongation factor-domain-containing protein n=1 Tax=Hygrophoropsis aurantiaca TaxID=72124 RepID=A0ACB8ASC9_9AGAM|nr:RNA polymerase II transcription elongation factor-domain-containing protein [Hygrophoropsis aurantiaca]